MARRIAAAILLTLWVMLVAGGATAYFVTRRLLLADFDTQLTSRAMAIVHAQRDDDQALLHVHPQDRFLITNEQGQMLMRSEATTAPAPLLQPTVINRTFADLGQGQRFRSLTLRIAGERNSQTGSVTVIYSSPMEYIQNVLAKLAWALGISGLAAGVLATVVALRVSRAALRPLRETATVIGSIDEAHLDRRIRTAALPAELVPMAQRLNGMLERLEQSFTQRKQFLADASHELRTPIAALLTTIEVAVRRKSSEEALRDTLKSCLGDARLLRELVEALMQQARSETLASHEPFAAIDVGEILREAVRLAQAEAQVKRVQVICKPGPVVVIETQVNRVRSIIRNILNNAVQHNRTAGTVEVASTVQDGELNIYVKDSGGGIRPEHLPHLFEPFYRADKARSEDGAHLGLGLFLVQTHLKALGGRCHVQSEPGVGTVFRVRIPLRKPAEAELSAIPQSPQTELAQGGAP